MSINLKPFTAQRLGDDLVVSSLNEALDAGLDIQGANDKGDFHMSKNDKPYFIMGKEGYRKIAVFVSKAVSEKVMTILDALDGYPVRTFNYVAADNSEQTTNMLCMPANTSGKYVSIGAAVAERKATAAAQKAEAIKLAEDKRAADIAAAALLTSNTPAGA